jgi:tetratricopeptide (TPR) repeat protein
MLPKSLYVLLVPMLALLFSYCQNASVQHEETPALLPYQNLSDSVQYVGMETCRSCHQNIYDTFIKTGMGESFAHATRAKSSASFNGHIAVYDSIADFYYSPFWRKDSLFIVEFRLQGKDTVHRNEQYIEYIVGSGQHTNSHIYSENGYLYQAPITFYTQKGIWDLAPGFSGGFNSRFNRIIGLECMSCHNTLPELVSGSENKYQTVPQGIGCERCHGAGAAHVQAKLAGNIVDTAVQVDYSIVNPRHLPRELQMDVCRRCHLQGVAVLKEGKSFDDFKPAMPLHSVMDVFLPEYDGNQTKFIMASQAHRLTKSACYQQSDMTCLNCHNPHISVKQTPSSHFNAACLRCHQADNAAANSPSMPQAKQQAACSLPLATRQQKNGNNCSACHMPVSPSIDIPHVTVHDHFIRRPIAASELHKIEKFIGLAAVNNPKIDAISQAKGYLHYYESYDNDITLLDSARYYLERAGNKPQQTFEAHIHWLYLKSDFDGIIQHAPNMDIGQINDAWTAYRIGEAHLQRQQYEQAAQYFTQSVTKMPLQADFNNKLSIALIQSGKTEQAIRSLEQLLYENPKHISGLTNLGFLQVAKGQLNEAEQLYKRALACNPDYAQALLNMAALKMLQQDQNAAKQYIQTLLRKQPNHSQAKELLKQLRL